MEFPRRLPHDEEAERAALSTVFVDNGNLAKILGKLEPSDFYLERHQIIATAFAEMETAGKAIDWLTAKANLEAGGKLEQIGGISYLATMDTDLPDLSNLDHYIDIIRDRSVRRRIVQSMVDGYQGAMDPGRHQTAADALAAVSESISLISSTEAESGWAGISEIVFDAIESLENEDEDPKAVNTGFSDVDFILQGMRPGHLVVLAGRPGMGKTAMAVNIAQHAITRQGKSVGIFSLEMSNRELALRMLSSMADVSGDRLKSKQIGRETMQSLVGAARELHSLPLHVDDNASNTMVQVLAKARQLHSEGQLDLLVIDYLQLMNAGGKHENRNLEVGAMSRNLKQLAKDLEIPVLALSQLSRKTENRGTNHRPQPSDLRESGSIEQDADVVAFVYRDEVYNPNEDDNHGIAELIIAKNRHGATGTVELSFRAETTTFSNLERYLEPPSGPMIPVHD